MKTSRLQRLTDKKSRLFFLAPGWILALPGPAEKYDPELVSFFLSIPPSLHPSISLACFVLLLTV